MVLIEESCCSNSLDARKRERDLYEELNATLNKQIPNHTKQEWRLSHNDEIVEYHQKYRQDNMVAIHKQKHLHYEQNKDRIKE